MYHQQEIHSIYIICQKCRTGYNRCVLASKRYYRLYMMLLIASFGGRIGIHYLNDVGGFSSSTFLPYPATVTAIPTGDGDSSHDQAIKDALSKGKIGTAIQIIRSISSPVPNDIKPISMGVRLMLDHLYIIDATDFQMSSINAKMADAIQLADLAIAANPDLPDGWCAKALALNWAYRSQDALSLILYTKDKWPNDPTTMVVQAEIETDLHEYSTASDLLDQAIKLIDMTSPINEALLARVFYIRGNLDQDLGHSDRAIIDYRAAWDISRRPYNPADPWMVVPPGYILYQLGPIYLFKNQVTIAEQLYKEALNIDHQDPFLYYLSGRADRYSGHLEDAVAEFRQCLTMDQQQWRCARNLGQIAFTKSDWRSAVRFIQPIIDDNSQISDDYYYVAMAYARLHECNSIASLIQHGETLLAHATGHPSWNQQDFSKIATICQLNTQPQ